MNIMMPYRPLQNQNRVEFIKKKFESSFAEENKTGSAKHSKDFCKSQQLSFDKSTAKNNFIKTGTFDSNKIDAKNLIKRTPAFRREKFSNSKSSILSQKSDVSENQEKSQNVVVKKDENLLENIKRQLQRSKTDTNLFKCCDNMKIDRNLHVDNIQGESEESGKILDQYSVVDKRKKTELKLSESIRRALQSPLPKGPPPKKPPRTFCHIPPSSNQSNRVGVTTATLSKADIPKLKSKLEKLEKVIKTHRAEDPITASKSDNKSGLHKKLKKISETSETHSVESDKKNENQSCLLFSNCLAQNRKDNNYEKFSKNNSEFHLNLEKSDTQSLGSIMNENSKALIPGGFKVKRSSSEPIYDLPCVNKRNQFETFGKYSKSEESQKKIDEGLHYMCTDVVKQVPVYPCFSSSFNLKKSLKADSWLCNTEPNLNSSGTQLFSNMNRRNDLVNSCQILSENDKTLSITNDLRRFGVYCSDGSDSESGDVACNDINSTDCLKSKGVTMDTEACLKAEEDLSQMTAKRKIYVSRVSSKLVNPTPYWKGSNKNSFTHLFECCLLVGLTLCESKKNVPYIKSIFPPEVKPPPLIESLCFPDASNWPPSSESQEPEEQCYSLVVTNENGVRKFGYCRRVLPEGGHFCLPLTYCIISPHRASGFFHKVLEELESRHGSPGIENFIKQLYESQFPGPGERLKFKEILEEASRSSPSITEYSSSTLLRRPCDVRLEEKDLTQLLEHLHLPVFLKVFSSLLHERKILLLSNSIRKLSLCIEALHSVLLPFLWQHTYIPVLPVHLIEMCEAPTPYVIGLLKTKKVEETVNHFHFEDGILVDLDDSRIIKCCGDEGSILPPRFIRELKTSLNLAITASDFSDSGRNVLISDAFIRFFVQVCGNYSKFIQTLANGEKIFEKGKFIKSLTSATAQSFLEWFTETAMFNSFIYERLHEEEEDVFVKLFRLRALEFSEGTKKNSTALLKNYKGINRKVRTLGDRIKDFTPFSK